MNRIFKYTIEVTDKQVIQLPASAQILTVQMQNGYPQLWAIVPAEPEAPKMRTIRMFGTGQAFENADRLRYIGTFQMIGGGLIFHVFEDK